MPGRVPGLEILINSGAIKECILDHEKTTDIPDLMESGSVQYGMQTFDQSIMKLYKQGMITFEEAMANASNPDDLDLRLKGIVGAADRWDGEKAPSSASSASGSGSGEGTANRELPGGFNKF